MKTILAIIALALAPVAFAQSPSISQSAEYPWRLQICDFAYTAGSLTAAPVTVFYRADITQGTTLLAQQPSTPASTTFDLVASGAKTVTVSGTTYTYAQALAIIQAIAAQERAAQAH